MSTKPKPKVSTHSTQSLYVSVPYYHICDIIIGLQTLGVVLHVCRPIVISYSLVMGDMGICESWEKKCLMAEARYNSRSSNVALVKS